MECGTADLPRLYQGLTEAGRSQTSPAPGCRGLGPGGALRRVQRGRGAHGDRRARRGTSPSRRGALQRTPGPSAVAWVGCHSAGRSSTV